MEERCREDGLKTWNNYSILKINKICGINWKTLKYIWDSKEQIEMSQSDFGIIADYFVKRRKGYKTIENYKQIKHVDEMLKFMRIFVEDERFWS